MERTIKLIMHVLLSILLLKLPNIFTSFIYWFLISKIPKTKIVLTKHKLNNSKELREINLKKGNTLK